MRRPRHDLLASTILMSALGAPAAAQVLDLDAAPPLPKLETSVLETLGREHRPDGEDVVSQVDSTLARLTIELASKGLLEGTAAPSAALAAIRLAEEKDRIVAALRPLRDPNAFTGSPPRILGDVDRRNATNLLARFSDRGLDVLRRGGIGSHREFSEAMTETFQPLLDAVVIIERTPARSPWPSSDPGHPSSMTSIRPDERSADDIESWGRNLETNHSLHNHVKNVLDRPGEQPIDPTSEFPQDLPDLVILRNAWEIDRSGIAAITGSMEHDEYRDRLEDILDWHSDIASRRALLAWIDIVNRSRRMNEIQLDQIPAETRSAARRVGRNHRTLVRRALDTWKEATATENRMLDGDVLPVFAALRESTGDVDRIVLAPSIARRLAGFAPEQSSRISNQLATWANALSDDRRRRNSATAIDEISRGIDRFYPNALEVATTSGLQAFDLATGKRTADLLDAIRAARRRWAEEVSDGTHDGPAFERLDRLTRLVEALDTICATDREMGRFQRIVERCNRWGGWYVDPKSLAWSNRTLVSSARLTTISAIEDNVSRFRNDIEDLEERLTVTRLLRTLSDRLEQLGVEPPPTTSDIVATFARAPRKHSWGLEYRTSTGTICLAIAEARHLRNQGRNDDRRRVDAWLREACDDLLDQWSMTTEDLPFP